MTSSRSPKVYDIQGKPIKVGYLVAYVARDPAQEDCMGARRVRRIMRSGEVDVGTEWLFAGNEVVVLEEPVWPNTR